MANLRQHSLMPSHVKLHPHIVGTLGALLIQEFLLQCVWHKKMWLCEEGPQMQLHKDFTNPQWVQNRVVKEGDMGNKLSMKLGFIRKPTVQ